MTISVRSQRIIENTLKDKRAAGEINTILDNSTVGPQGCLCYGRMVNRWSKLQNSLLYKEELNDL